MAMRCIGTIIIPSATEQITQEQWEGIVQSYQLTPIPSFVTLNPFTQEPCEIGPGGESAACSIDGDTIGVIRWSPEGYGIDVHFDGDERMHEFAAMLAEQHGGVVESL